MPSKVKDWKAEDLEWFFHKDLGIIGIDGKQKKDPKVSGYSNIGEAKY